ncbi:MAG: hypothetical protein FWC40_02720 [Proteobacteria bacterium]|nr:hypothetical protein [Pseudomonadota bacterium]
MTETAHDLFEIRTMSRHLRHGEYEAFRQALGSASYSFLPHFELLKDEQWEALLMCWIEIGNIEAPADEVEALVMSRLADGLMEQSAYDAAWVVLGLLRDSSKAKKKRAKCFEALMAALVEGDSLYQNGPIDLYHERCIRFFEQHPEIEGGELCTARLRYEADGELPECEATWPIFEAIRVVDPCFENPSCSPQCMRETCEDKVRALAEDNSKIAREVRLKYAFGTEDWPMALQLAKDLARYESCDSSHAWLVWLLEGLLNSAQQLELSVMVAWSEEQWNMFDQPNDWETRVKALAKDWEVYYAISTACYWEADENFDLTEVLNEEFQRLEVSKNANYVLPVSRAIRAALACDWQEVNLLVDALPEPWPTHYVTFALKLQACQDDSRTYLIQLKEALRSCPCATFDACMAECEEAEIGDRLEAFERLLQNHGTHLYFLTPSVTRELYDKMSEASRTKARPILESYVWSLQNNDPEENVTTDPSSPKPGSTQPNPQPASSPSALKQTFIIALIIAAILGVAYYFMR